MNAQTRMSARGQIVIPKAVRNLKSWVPGTVFDIIDTGAGVMLQPESQLPKLSVEDVTSRLAKRAARYARTEPVPVDQISRLSDQILRTGLADDASR